MWLCSIPLKSPRLFVMVWGVVSNVVDLMPAHFFPQDLKVNATDYINPWIGEVSQRRPWAYQHDSVSFHTAGKTQKWMAENFCDQVTFNIWSLISFDLKPIDNYVRGVVNMETRYHPHNTEDSLKAGIGGIMADMNKEYLIEACNPFRNCVEALNETDLVYN